MSIRSKGVRLSHRAVKANSRRRADLPNPKDPEGKKGGLFVRSSMEANVLRVFEFLKHRGIVFSWVYEARVYTFAEFGYRRGPWAYTPDVLVNWYRDALEDPLRRSWAETIPGSRPDISMVAGAISVVEEEFEVKGRETGSDRSKAKRMSKHYPDVTLTRIGKAEYRALEKLYKPILGELWE